MSRKQQVNIDRNESKYCLLKIKSFPMFNTVFKKNLENAFPLLYKK